MEIMTITMMMTMTMITICYVTFLITFWLSAEIAGLRQSSNTYRPVLTYICKYYFIFNRLDEEDLPFEAHLKVRLINDQHTAQVEFRNTFQPTGRNLSLCTLCLAIPSQCSYIMVSRMFRIGSQVQVAKSSLNFPEGVLNKVLSVPPRGPTPYPFIYHFWQKSYPFRIHFIGK